jgi:hypothetical protein
MTDTNQALQAFLMAGQGKCPAFPPTSRYYGVETALMQTPDGRTVIFLKRRLVPAPENFSVLQYHTVGQGERPDTIAAKYCGDPEQFWRLCDANRILMPNELIETDGREVRITLPEGLPAMPNA